MFKPGHIFKSFFMCNGYTRAVLMCILSLFVVFNCTFASASSVCSEIDVSGIINIQKDIFSAVFTVSNIINKINNSFCSKTVTSENKNKSSDKEKDTPFKTANDVILTENSSEENRFLLSDTFSAVCTSADPSESFSIGNTDIKYTGCCYFLIYFMTMICFFGSAKKIYDVFFYKNICKNPLF